MRKIEKIAAPQLLAENAQQWTADYIADPESSTKKFRYRNKEIKDRLREEAENKCVYCESKVGHNTPGDVEHKVPTSESPDLHFSWANLTIACTECNRRKGGYFDLDCPFLDPYTDEVEDRLIHHGPIVGWAIGDGPAENTVRVLQLHDNSRTYLIARKVEKIVELNEVLERRNAATDPVLQSLLDVRLLEMQDRSSEFSAMVQTICQSIG